MVRHILTGLLLLCLMPRPLLANEFDLTVKETTVQLGKPVWLHLSNTQTTTSLARIDFSKLDTDFEVVKDNNAIRQQDGQQSWRVRLYPRRIGKLTIPPLHLNGQHSKAINIIVTDPIDTKTGQRFSVDYQLSTSNPWARQQVLAMYNIHSREPKLILRPQERDVGHMQIVPLGTKSQQQENHYRHQSGWALFASRVGLRQFKLPALYTIRDGVITHRFYPPKVKLDVKALPAYLPGNIPVGRFTFNIGKRSSLVLNGHLSDLNVQLRGEGVPGQWLPDLRHLFSSSHQLNIYPVETKTSQNRRGRLTSSHAWRIPFKTIQQGSIDLPRVTLHYFDPQTGKLAKLDIQIPRFISLSLWLVMLLVIIGMVVTVWFSIKLYHWFIPHWHCFNTYRTILKSIPKQHNPQEIRELIKQLGQAEGWSNNLSLRQWQARQAPRIANHAQEISRQLEASLYQGKQCDIKSIHEGIRQVCINRWAVLRWVITS